MGSLADHSDSMDKTKPLLLPSLPVHFSTPKTEEKPFFKTKKFQLFTVVEIVAVICGAVYLHQALHRVGVQHADNGVTPLCTSRIDNVLLKLHLERQLCLVNNDFDCQAAVSSKISRLVDYQSLERLPVDVSRVRVFVNVRTINCFFVFVHFMLAFSAIAALDNCGLISGYTVLGLIGALLVVFVSSFCFCLYKVIVFCPPLDWV